MNEWQFILEFIRMFNDSLDNWWISLVTYLYYIGISFIKRLDPKIELLIYIYMLLPETHE